jgi:hypothetical protein
MQCLRQKCTVVHLKKNSSPFAYFLNEIQEYCSKIPQGIRTCRKRNKMLFRAHIGLFGDHHENPFKNADLHLKNIPKNIKMIYFYH